MTHIGTLSYLFFLADDYSSKEGRIVGVFVIILTYYRGFSFLRIFDTFITLVGMINIIIRQLLSFFVILGYAYFTVSMLVIKMDNSNKIGLRFQDVFTWVLFGSVEDVAFDVQFSYIAIVFSALFITIVLLNILIAYLSNLFSRLEDQQKVSSLKEKAILILDFELIARFFRFSLFGTPKLVGHRDDIVSHHVLNNKEFYLKDVTFINIIN